MTPTEALAYLWELAADAVRAQGERNILVGRKTLQKFLAVVEPLLEREIANEGGPATGESDTEDAATTVARTPPASAEGQVEAGALTREDLLEQARNACRNGFRDVQYGGPLCCSAIQCSCESTLDIVWPLIQPQAQEK